MTIHAPDQTTATNLLALLREAAPALEAAAVAADADAEVASESWALLRRTGLLRAALPVAEGGVDLAAPGQAMALADTLRFLGSIDLVLARLVEGHVNALALVQRYGTAEQRQELAAAVRDGALSAVWGADGTQPLRAERAASVTRLHGGKILASGAGTIDCPLVTAATPEGPQLLLLNLARHDRFDLSGWAAQGMRATATGTVDLDGMVVGQDAIIGAPGDFLRQPHFSGGAWRFCAAHTGAAERLTDLFRAHLVERGRDRDPYQLQRIAACTAAVTTARFWVEAAARQLAGDGPAETVVAFVNLTRGVTERACLDVLEAVHRGVGLGGFVRPNPIERITRDLSTYLRQPVPDLAMADAGLSVLRSAQPVNTLWGAH